MSLTSRARLDRFENVVVGAGGKSFGLALDARLRGQHQDAVTACAGRREALHHLHAAHARHLDVADDDVRALPKRHLEAGRPSSATSTSKPSSSRKYFTTDDDRGAVFDDEHPAADLAAIGGHWRPRTLAYARRVRDRSGDRMLWFSGLGRDTKHFVERGQALRGLVDAVLEQRPHAGSPRGLLITCSAARLEIRSRTSSVTGSTSWMAIRPSRPDCPHWSQPRPATHCPSGGSRDAPPSSRRRRRRLLR